MFSLRTLITGLISALLSGGVGFASAWYLQKQEAAQQQRVWVEQRRLELEQLNQDRRRERTYALYGEWTSPDMTATRNSVRDLLLGHPGENYESLRDVDGVSGERLSALDRILGFLGSVDDLAESNSIDPELAGGLMQPYLTYWGRELPRLRTGVDSTDEDYGKVLLAERGLARLGVDIDVLPRDEIPAYSPPQD